LRYREIEEEGKGREDGTEGGREKHPKNKFLVMALKIL